MSFFENLLIGHCSPTLLGLKQASLFSCSMDKGKEIFREMNNYNSLLNSKDIFFKVLYSYKTKFFVIAYKKKPMLTSLKSHNVHCVLSSIGYPPVNSESDIDKALDFLGNRFSSLDAFPHEIGFFLGYPESDVLEFIKQKGQNFKFCGYWKVYSNEENAIKIFKRYKKCKEVLSNKINSGICVLEILGVA